MLLIYNNYVLLSGQVFGSQQTSANWGHDSTIVDKESITKLSPKPSGGPSHKVDALNSSNSGKRRRKSWVTSNVSINFMITQITLEPIFDHLFATYSYTSYWQFGEFLTNTNCRLSYSPKFGSQKFCTPLHFMNCLNA